MIHTLVQRSGESREGTLSNLLRFVGGLSREEREKYVIWERTAHGAPFPLCTGAPVGVHVLPLVLAPWPVPADLPAGASAYRKVGGIELQYECLTALLLGAGALERAGLYHGGADAVGFWHGPGHAAYVREGGGVAGNRPPPGSTVVRCQRPRGSRLGRGPGGPAPQCLDHRGVLRNDRERSEGGPRGPSSRQLGVYTGLAASP